MMSPTKKSHQVGNVIPDVVSWTALRNDPHESVHNRNRPGLFKPNPMRSIILMNRKWN